jgi:cytochrome c oxidase accessory protein FixG
MYDTLIITYDPIRGEPRGARKKATSEVNPLGDCVDCGICVQVCPVGIDIRNGTQLECINCTACIDACDSIMEGVGLEKGLIRFVSEESIEKRTGFEWTRRVKAYTILLGGLLAVLIVLLATRKDLDTTIMHQRGTTFQMTDDGYVSNIFEINVINKTTNTYKIKLTLEDKEGVIEMVVKHLTLKKETGLKERFIVKLPLSKIKNGLYILHVNVIGNGEIIETVKTKFIGPML